MYVVGSWGHGPVGEYGRQVPDARNGLRAGQSANPDFIAAIDSNRRRSYIRFVTLTVIQNAHRAGTLERELAFLQPVQVS